MVGITLSCGYAGCHHPEKRDGWCLYHLLRKDPEEINGFISYVGQQIEKQASGVIDFEGFVFPAGYKFPDRILTKSVNFIKALFEGDVTFEKMHFQGGAIFNEAKFHGRCVMRNSTFGVLGSTDHISAFDNVEFEELSFENIDFNEYVQFSGAIFNGGVTLDHTRFHQNANFQATTFSGTAGFLNVVFQRDAWFSPFNSRKTSFAKYVTFAQTGFVGLGLFDDVTFSSDSNFDQAFFVRKPKWFLRRAIYQWVMRVQFTDISEK